MPGKHEQVMIGRRHVYAAGLDRFTMLRVLNGKAAFTIEDLRQQTRAFGGSVYDDEDRGSEVSREPAKNPGYRLHRTGGPCNRYNVSSCHRFPANVCALKLGNDNSEVCSF